MFYLFIVIVVIATAVLAWMRFRDRRYLNAKTRDILSESVKKDIESDQKEFEELQKKFAGTLTKQAQAKYKASEIITKKNP
ncbi:hypothetical protein K1X76_09860 [bacterium]|nr:hypothetical protein [bacterium]